MSGRQGSKHVTTVTKGGNKYQKVDLTTVFQQVSFGFGATQLNIKNEASNPCQFSFDGSEVAGIVLEKSWDNATLAGQSSAWFRVTTGTGTGYVRAY